jgi:hypothetical protein
MAVATSHWEDLASGRATHKGELSLAGEIYRGEPLVAEIAPASSVGSRAVQGGASWEQGPSGSSGGEQGGSKTRGAGGNREH